VVLVRATRAADPTHSTLATPGAA